MRPARRRSPACNRDALVEGLRARGHRSVVPLPSPARLAEMVHAIAKPGDFVVCLGAGIDHPMGRTRLPAAQLAGPLQARDGTPPAGTSGRDMTWPAAPATDAAPSAWCDMLPPLRGRVQARRAAGAAHLVPRRRRRRGAGPPGGCRRTSRSSSRPCRATCRCTCIGARSNLIVRDGGLPGVMIRLARGFTPLPSRPTA